MKKLSIFIPVWNQQTLIVKALDSIPRRPDIEVIAWDDGSTDKSRAVMEQYRDEHPDLDFTVCGSDKNAGYNIAKNNLLDRCRGEYVHCLDSDDWLVTDEYEKAMDELDGTDIVCIDLVVNSGEVIPLSEETWQKFCGSPCRFIRRGFLGDTRFIADRESDRDWWFNEALLKRNPTRKFTHIAAYHYNYPRQGSLVNIAIRKQKREKLGRGTPVFKNVFWFPQINDIGGVETMYYTLARKYGKTHDITIFYRTAAPAQLARLKEYVRCIKIRPGDHIVAEKAFFNHNVSIIDQVDADEYYLLIHADLHYGEWKPPTHPKITRYIGVSEVARKGFVDLTDGQYPCEVVYNPFLLDKPKKVLRLITASRLTPEKGKKRMVQLADALDRAGIPFVWDIYTNDTDAIKHPNIRYCAPRLDIIDYIAASDYLVQLSDTEAYAYSMLEALTAGVPVIVTDFPSAHEMGVKNGVNGFILPFDMSEIPVDAIYKGVKKFKFSPPADQWGDILAPGKGDYEEVLQGPVRLKCTSPYLDLVLGRELHIDEEFELPRERADKIVLLGYAREIDI